LIQKKDFQFFKLTLLAEQLNHLHFDRVKSVDVYQLWYKAIDEHNLSFNKFRKFIVQELDKYYIDKVKNADADRFIGHQN
jgi:hypothetical protein